MSKGPPSVRSCSTSSVRVALRLLALHSCSSSSCSFHQLSLLPSLLFTPPLLLSHAPSHLVPSLTSPSHLPTLSSPLAPFPSPPSPSSLAAPSSHAAWACPVPPSPPCVTVLVVSPASLHSRRPPSLPAPLCPPLPVLARLSQSSSASPGPRPPLLTLACPPLLLILRSPSLLLTLCSCSPPQPPPLPSALLSPALGLTLSRWMATMKAGGRQRQQPLLFVVRPCPCCAVGERRRSVMAR
ncbi:hypothetical protein CPC08DRAFT_767210 [Agrocybe pediades]|nr:hypothetical protein CPC08DRAFT_767210 [Agrocybe pediades]